MALVVLGSLVVLFAYYTWGVRRTDFGGKSFGTRHLLAITPACYLFAVVALERLRWRVVPVLFVLAMGVGGFYAVAGAKDPWTRIEERTRERPLARDVAQMARDLSDGIRTAKSSESSR